jgi:hypothetical protein
MGIKEILGKLGERMNRPQHPRLSSEEVELMSFKEKERRDMIRAELRKYKLRHNHDLLIGADLISGEATFLKNDGTILKSPATLLQKPKKPIMDMENLFLR